MSKYVKDDEAQVATLESYPLVNRVEIIGRTGREFVKHEIEGISTSIQDNGRTLKVFVESATSVIYKLEE